MVLNQGSDQNPVLLLPIFRAIFGHFHKKKNTIMKIFLEIVSRNEYHRYWCWKNDEAQYVVAIIRSALLTAGGGT